MKKYYPWVVCVLCLLLSFCACGLVTVAFSTYLPFLKESAGLTGTEVSMITTIRCLSTMIFMLVSGPYYKKFSLRMGVFLAVLTVPVAYLIFAHAHTAIACYIGAVVLGIPYALGNVIPITQIIRNWFKSREATALAFVMCGSGVSTAVMPPVITKLVDHFGLVTAFYAVGIFTVIAAIAIFAIVRDKPEDMGLEPYRGNEKVKEKKKSVIHLNKNLSGREMIWFALIMLLMGYVGTPYTHHMSLHYTNVGYTGIQAAFAVSIYGGFLIISKVAFGAGADRFGAYRVNYFFFGAWILGSMITVFLNGESIPALYGSEVLNGLGISLGTIGMTVWTGDLSSDEMYGKRVKLSQTLFQLGSLVGSPVPGIIADVTGSYAGAYISFTVALVAIMVIIQNMYKRHMVR